MITNILAAVVITLVTNVVPSDNTVWERDPVFSWPEGGGPMRVRTPATERYETTTVTEHAAITLTVLGEQRTFTADKLLSSVTAIWRKSDEWQAAGVRTNSVEPTTGSIVWTNSFSYPLLTMTNILVLP